MSLISRWTGPHRPRKHKKENDCNAPSRTPASALVAVFSSSPVNFFRALNIFEKCFFTTLVASPLHSTRFLLCSWHFDQSLNSELPVDGLMKKKFKQTFHTSKKGNGIHTNRNCMKTCQIQRVVCTGENSAFLLISLIRFWTSVCRPARGATSSSFRGRKISWTFTRWRHRVYSTVEQLFLKRSDICSFRNISENENLLVLIRPIARGVKPTLKFFSPPWKKMCWT